MRLVPAGIVVLLVFAGGGCARRLAVRPQTERVAVFVTGDLDSGSLPLQAAAVQEARKLVPTLWFVVGNVLVETLWAEMSAAEAQARLLGTAGVDAVLMGPEWLRYGSGRIRALADIGRFYLLAANIVDTTRRAIGHELMVRQLGTLTLGVTGLCLDTSAVELGQVELTLLPASYTAARAGVLLRRRAGVTVMLAGTDGVGQGAGYDLIIAPAGSAAAVLTPCSEPGAVARYDIELVAGSVAGVTRREVSLSEYKPVEAVARVRDSINSAIDSQAVLVVAESRVALTPSVLGRALARALIAEQRLDYVVLDTSGVEAIMPGNITLGMLCRALGGAGRLVLLELEGQRVRDLLRAHGVVVESRPGIRAQRLALRRDYAVGTTTEFIRRHPELAGYQYRMIASPPWQLMATVLRREGRAR